MRWLVGVLALAWSLVAGGHPMPESRVWVDTAPHGVTLTLQLPLNRLEFAFGQQLAGTPGDVLPRHAEALSRYLLQHVGARSVDQGWQVLRPKLSVVGNDSAAELEAVFDMRAPPGADPRQFTLLYDVITHEVKTHRALVYLRNDWAAGRVAGAPRLLGELSPERNALPVALVAGGEESAVLGLFKLGARHIAEGTDHLLFLLTLILVAPLQAAGTRWAGVRPRGAAVRRLIAVVTAFTLGHSLTLVLGSTGLLVLPSQPVEIAVAVSIAIAAVHALRPLVRGGEVVMAAGFGLLHGLAFAASLSGAGLTAGQHALALLAFNLGIEAVQLLVVACAVPPLLVLAGATPRAYAILRVSLALLACAAAAAWMFERLLPAREGVAAWTDAVAASWPALAGLLWLAALLAWLSRRWGLGSAAPVGNDERL